MTNGKQAQQNEESARFKAAGKWFAVAKQRIGRLGIARESWANVFLTVVGLLAFAGIAYYLNGVWMGDPSIGRAGDPERAKFIATLFGGAFSLLLIYVSYRRATAMEKTAKAAQQTADSTDKGNIAERFKTAIEHLGSAVASVRLGGIYALHHIAIEHADYRSRVFDILCAHVRETTSPENGYKPRKEPFAPIIFEFKATIEIETASDLVDILQDKVRVKPTIEIQSILDLLFVKDAHAHVYAGLPADLTGANLEGADLGKAQLPDAILNGAVLSHSRLEEANLQNAQLNDVELQKAWMPSADLRNAILKLADLRGVGMPGAKLESANLYCADLCSTQLNCNLQNAALEGANLSTAWLADAENLTVGQLREVCSLFKSRDFPGYLEKEIKKLEMEAPGLFAERSVEEYYSIRNLGKDLEPSDDDGIVM